MEKLEKGLNLTASDIFELQRFAGSGVLDLTVATASVGNTADGSATIYALGDGTFTTATQTNYAAVFTATLTSGVFNPVDVTDVSAGSSLGTVYVMGTAAGVNLNGSMNGVTVVLDDDANHTNGTVASFTTTSSVTVASGQKLSKAAGDLGLTAGTLSLSGSVTINQVTMANGTVLKATDDVTAKTADAKVSVSANEFTLQAGTFTADYGSSQTYDVNAASAVTVSGFVFESGAVGVLNSSTSVTLNSGSASVNNSGVTSLTVGGVALTLDATSVMSGITSSATNNVTIGSFTSGGASWSSTATVALSGVQFDGKGSFSGAGGTLSTATVTDGSATLDGTLSAITVTANGGAFAFAGNAKAVVGSTGNVTNFTAGTVGVTTYTGSLTFGSGSTAAGVTLSNVSGTVASDGTVTNWTGTGHITTNAYTSSISLNNDVFTRASGNNGTMDFGLASDGPNAGKPSVITGTLQLDANKTLYGIASNLGSGQYATIANGSGTVSFNSGAATLTGLDAGETATIYTNTGLAYQYKAISSTMVELTVATGAPSYYAVKEGYSLGTVGFTTSTASMDSKLTAADGGNIEVSKYETTTWFMANGAATPTEPTDAKSWAAKLTTSGSGENISRTLEVKAGLNTGVGIDLKGVNATVTDAGTDNDAHIFNITAGGITSGIKAKGFEINSDGVISNASGAVTLLSGVTTGTITTSTSPLVSVAGGVSVDVTALNSANIDAVTYVAGTGVNGASVTIDSGLSAINLTESTNSTDTVIQADGDIKGLDAGATVKNAISNKTIETAGNETGDSAYTLNGVTWTVNGDDKATFTVNDNMTSKVSSIANLDLDATVITDKKFSEETISVNSITFNSITSKDGVKFTSTKKDSEASITLNAKGEGVVIGAYRYTVKSTSDDITIDNNGNVSGLTNGDVLTVQLATVTSGDNSSYVFTANNDALVVSGFTATGASLDATTYMRDSDETSFTAKVNDNTFSSTRKTSVSVSGGQSGTDISGFSVTTGTNATKNVDSITNGMWLDKDGNTLADNSQGKAVSQVFIDDDKVTYTEIGDKAQAVQVTAAETTHEWSITTNGGKDTIDYAGKQSATISAGAGNDTVSVNSNADVTVNLGAGKDEVVLAGAGAHTLVAGDGDKTINATATTGDIVIDGRGSGKKSITRLGAAGGEATLYGGDGNDTIVARGLDDSVVGGAGNNLFDVSQSSMKVSDYDVSKDTFLVASTSLAANALGGDGVVTLGGGIKADVSAGTGTSGYYAVSAKSTVSGAKAQTYGWTTDNGGEINLNGGLDKAVVLVGSHNDGAKDLLVGGSKNDTIIGGSNDSLYGGGAGKNRITLGGVSAYVGIGGTAKDTVSSFSTGFDNSEADTVLLIDGSMSDASFSVASTGTGTSRDVTIKSGQASLELSSLAVDSVSGAYQMLVGENKVYAIAEGATASLNGDNYADYYIGTKSSKIDGSQVDTAFKVDLSDTEHIRNIKQVTGGSENTTLMGSGVDATLSAGTGSATLWGGAGKDSLIGGNAADTFVFMAGDGKDTISSFATGTGDTADVIDFWQSSPTGVTRTSTSQFKVTLSDNDAVTVNTSTSGGANDVIQWKDENGNKGTVKVGIKGQNNGFTYESGVGGYYGSSTGQDTLTVSTSDDVNVWLDGSQGTAFADINAINASSATGNAILAGDSNSQVITGGRGSSSLWGGAGSTKDTLVAGNGTNTFFYGYGEGSDLVNNTGENDVINLYNITLNDLSGYEINGNKVTITTKAGDTLTVNGKATTYLVGDGQGNIITAHANHSTNKWE